MESQRIDPDYVSSLSGSNLEYNNIIQFQLDNKQELEDLRAELLGLEWDQEIQDYVKSIYKKPMMNEIGANAVLSTLSPRTTKIFSLSNHRDIEDVDTRCKRYLDGLTIMLVRHKNIYDIPSYAILDVVLDLCDDVFRATLLKSLRGWEGEGIRGQVSHQEVRQTIIEDKQKSKNPINLSLFKPRRR